nr:hypothetical protein [Haloarcula taiwanensis]
MRLYISGGKHIHWDSTDRVEEITQALNGEPQVVLVESSSEPDNDREKQYNLLAAPLILCCLILWSLCLKALRIPFGSDQELVQSISDAPDVAEVKVDRPMTPLISEARIAWAFSNWLIILLVTLVYFSSGVYSALFVLVMFVAVLFVSFIASTAAPRNYAIAMNTMQTAKENEYERGVLVVGSEHEKEVKKHIKRASTEVEIVES